MEIDAAAEKRATELGQAEASLAGLSIKDPGLDTGRGVHGRDFPPLFASGRSNKYTPPGRRPQPVATAHYRSSIVEDPAKMSMRVLTQGFPPLSASGRSNKYAPSGRRPQLVASAHSRSSSGDDEPFVYDLSTP
jgi:hypothetical protein